MSAEHSTRAGAVAHISKKRRRPGISIASAHRRHATPVAATLSVQRASAAAAPTFDNIPRQVTPEGNVLHVSASRNPAEVERWCR